MFWENYVKLCNKVGKSPSAVAVEIGFSNASAVGWKKKATPRQTTLLKIANYFGVTVSELTGEEQKETPTPISEGRPMPPVEYNNLTPEQRKIVDDLIRNLAAQNPK